MVVTILKQIQLICGLALFTAWDSDKRKETINLPFNLNNMNQLHQSLIIGFLFGINCSYAQKNSLQVGVESTSTVDFFHNSTKPNLPYQDVIKRSFSQNNRIALGIEGGLNSSILGGGIGKTFTNSTNLLLGASYRLKPLKPHTENKVAFSQNNRITVGIQGGLNSTSIREGKYPHYASTSPRYGYSTGLTFAWNSSRHFSLQTGILMDHKVYSWQTSTSNDFPVTSTYTKSISSFDYLTLPILSRFTFGKKVNFFVNAGVFIGVLVSQQDALEIENYSSSGLNSYHSSEKRKDHNIKDYNPVDIGVAGGFGIGIPIKKQWSISIEARDCIGLVNTKVSQDIKTNTLSLLVGVNYKLSFRENQ
jgi:hypothetical protein